MAMERKENRHNRPRQERQRNRDGDGRPRYRDTWWRDLHHQKMANGQDAFAWNRAMSKKDVHGYLQHHKKKGASSIVIADGVHGAKGQYKVYEQGDDPWIPHPSFIDIPPKNKPRPTFHEEDKMVIDHLQMNEVAEAYDMGLGMNHHQRAEFEKKAQEKNVLFAHCYGTDHQYFKNDPRYGGNGQIQESDYIFTTERHDRPRQQRQRDRQRYRHKK